MIKFVVLALAASASLCMSACSTTTTDHLLTNLSTDCERHYDGAINAGMTGGGFTGTVKIDCAPKGAVTP
jgi:hypothetical protein